MSSPTRVAIYTRVSTDIQASAEEGSLDTQEAALRKFAEATYGDNVAIRVFREEGQSGKNLDRPAMHRLRRATANREIDIVMVTRIDRFSRSLLDFCSVSESLKEHGVAFKSLKDSFDTSTAAGDAMLKILLVFAELERRQTSERTVVALQVRAESGLWNGGYPMLGYDPDGKGSLIVLEGEAAIVQYAFEQFVSLQSTRKLAKALNEKGYRTKRFTSRRGRIQGGKEFNQSAVATILRNRTYVGEVSNNELWYSGRHVGIIDQDLFDRVQVIVEANGRGAKQPRKVQPLPYLLTGLVRCGCCNNEDGTPKFLTSWTTRGRGGKRYRYYRCTSEGKQAVSDCKIGNRAADPLETLVLATVRRAVTEPSIVEEAVTEAERMLREEITPARARVKEMRGDRDRLRRDSEMFFDEAMSKGFAGLDIAQRRLQEMQVRIRQLDEAIQDEEATLAVQETRHLDHEVVLAALTGFDALFEVMEHAERKELLALLIKSVTVHPDDRITLDLHDGQEVTERLEQVKKKSRGGNNGGGPTGAGGKGAASSQNGEGPTTPPGEVERLAQRLVWLPGADRRQNLGDEVLDDAASPVWEP